MAEALPTEALVRLNSASVAARLVSSVVHDLNNGLLVIGGSVELMEDTPLTEQQRPRLERIGRQQLQMAETLRELTAVLKPEETDRKCDVAATVAHACHLRATAFRRLGIQVKGLPVDRVGFHVSLPSDRLLQILLNLLLNAETALRDAPVREIELQLVESSGNARLTLSDSGPGFPAVLRPTLGQPFVTATPEESAGLGLFVSRVLAERAGGSLTLGDDAGGARLDLTLPLCRLPEGR